MSSAIIEESPDRALWRHPAVWAIINLLITLYGILFKGWSLQPIVYIFWIEIILQIISTLIRVLGAMNGRPFWDTIGQKIFSLLFGSAMAVAFILLSVTFTFNVFKNGVEANGFEGINEQVTILIINYIAALLLQYFLNGRYRNASPVGELASTMVYLLILLAFIMVITQHLAPRYAGEHAPLWTGLAVVGVKFVVDWFFAAAKRPLSNLFSEAD